MNNKFCKRCHGKLFCVHNEPEMSGEDIVHLILLAFINNSKIGLETLYKYLIPEYRNKIGGIRNLGKLLERKFPGFIDSINLSILDKFQEDSECSGKIQIQYFHNGNPKIIVLTMHRAFNYISNKSLYDRLTKEELNLYWRIVDIKAGEGITGRRSFTFSREI